MAETEERNGEVLAAEDEVPDGTATEQTDSTEPADSTAADPQDESLSGQDGQSAGSIVQDELLAAERQRDEYKDALVRERADFENYKKRNAALASTSFDSGVESAVNAVLPVLDNFERALAVECADKQFASGMEMTMRQLEAALQGLGVEQIASDGAFDPTRHHAIAQSEDPDLGSNMIAQTLQKGYTLKGRVIRPAMVKVNK